MEPPPKRFKLYEPPTINNIKDLIRIAENFFFYKHVDTIALWRILPHLKELDELIGMESVKKTIFNQILYYIQGLHKNDTNGEYLHMKIVGPPGTGKTTVANIIANIYKELGILKGDADVRLAHRDDFIAGFVGQTSIKTKKLMKECLGGVLFYDEGYSMGSSKNDDTFAKEAVDTITSFLSEHKTDFCFIIAGYEEDIEKYFFSMNKGLARRIPWCHKIDPYTPEEMAEIAICMIKKIEWNCNVEKKDIAELIKNNIELFKHSGGSVETFIMKSKICHGVRVFTLPQEDKFILSLADMKNGISAMMQNTPKEDIRYMDMFS